MNEAILIAGVAPDLGATLSKSLGGARRSSLANAVSAARLSELIVLGGDCDDEALALAIRRIHDASAVSPDIIILMDENRAPLELFEAGATEIISPAAPPGAIAARIRLSLRTRRCDRAVSHAISEAETPGLGPGEAPVRCGMIGAPETAAKALAACEVELGVVFQGLSHVDADAPGDLFVIWSNADPTGNGASSLANGAEGLLRPTLWCGDGRPEGFDETVDRMRADASAAALMIRLRALIRRARLERRRLGAVEAGMRLAATDELTGLRNRRFIEARLARMAAEARLSAAPLSVLMVDIDRFKAVNDRHGHAIGDAVLRAFAERLGAVFRKQDSVARVGGEEFMVLLPGASLEQAGQAAERLRASLRSRALQIGESGEARLTVSIGAAVLQAGQDGPGDLARRADFALLAAKSQGRNRVCLAPDAPARRVRLTSNYRTFTPVANRVSRQGGARSVSGRTTVV